MQDDTVSEAEQRLLANMIVDHLLMPRPPMSDFTRRYIIERQWLDFYHPFDEPPDPPVPVFTLEEIEGVEP